MKKTISYKDLKEMLKHHPYIVVGINSCESIEICETLKNHGLHYHKADLGDKDPVWENVDSRHKQKAAEAMDAGRALICFAMKHSDDEPANTVCVPLVTYMTDSMKEDKGPLETLDMALDGEGNPYHELVIANTWGTVFEMRKVAKRLSNNPHADKICKAMMKASGISKCELEAFVNHEYDTSEYGMEKIPNEYRRFYACVIHTIKRKDRQGHGVTIDEEHQAEKAVLNAYTIGSITVAESEVTKPTPILDRLRESEKYGLLMLLGGGLTYFFGPSDKVKKMAEHFPDGKIGGTFEGYSYWYGHYSQPFILDYFQKEYN